MKANTKTTFKLNALLSCMLLSGGLSSVAQAEDTEMQDVEVIEVNGFRSSLNAALLEKRASVGSKETIVAEDIGKFPDLNIADSLARVPGIAIEQDAGEGRQITIRGLGSRYVKTTINGMESASAGAATDAAGGSNKTRAFDYNIFASELFTQVDIHKTVSAELEDGGISGNVNLETASPLNNDGLQVAYNVNARYNDISEEATPRASFMVANNWDDKFGALLSVAYSEGIVQSEGASTVRWTDKRGKAAIDATNGFTEAQVEDLFVTRIPRYSVFEKNQERLGVSASFEYRPMETLNLKADFLHATLDTETNEYQYSALIRSNPTGIDPLNMVVDGQNNIVAGAFSDVQIRSEARQDVSESTFDQFTLQGDWDINDDLKMTFLVGKGESKLIVPHQITFAVDSTDSTFAYSYDASVDPLDLINASSASGSNTLTQGGTINMEMPSFAFLPGTAPQAGTQYSRDSVASAMVDPTAYSLALTRHRNENIDSANESIKVDFEYAVNDAMTIKFGAGSRSFETEFSTARNDNKVSVDHDGDAATSNRSTKLEDFTFYDALVPASEKLGSDYGDVLSAFGTNFGNAVDIPSTSSLGNATWFAPDYNAVYNAVKGKSYFQPSVEYDRGYRVKEEVFTAYAQVDYVHEIFDRDLRTNFGVRYIDNTNTSWGPNTSNLANSGFDVRDASLPIYVETGSTSDDILPSVNLAFDLTDDLVLRASWSEAITRPAISVLASAVKVSEPSENNPEGKIEIGAGPTLKPYEATNIDLGLEWYFAEESLLAAAIFAKDITNLSKITDTIQLTEADLKGYGIDYDSVTSGYDLATTDWDLTYSTSTEPESMWGAEFIYQQPFTFLPAPFDGLGVQANYTYIDYEREYTSPVSGVTANLTEFETSENSYNMTVYFEQDIWSARFSYNFRESYVKQYDNRSSEGTWGRGYDDKGILNFSSRYDINDNVSLAFEAINLTNAGSIQWHNVESQKPYESLWNGRQFLVGVRGSL
ncbi:TonB-dependent receptor [Algibacillus agarilyticus]|uniref:TonB-dependent receptor n=1 Tax=Algibacillus agarilyticus TaxID=2234133 RepID=UPI000DCFD8E0|nr:TonB-dependent receptor [Algibacillus agarilyticus]